MPVEIQGVSFLTTPEVEERVRVSRSTLWRWRKAGKVPVGYRRRGQQVLFSPTDVNAICEYATQALPIELSQRPDRTSVGKEAPS